MCSINLTHPGEHDVIIGKATSFLSTSASFSLVNSSVPSSMIVRSAEKSVSRTESKPIFFKAVTIFPVTLVPTG